MYKSLKKSHNLSFLSVVYGNFHVYNIKSLCHCGRNGFDAQKLRWLIKRLGSNSGLFRFYFSLFFFFLFFFKDKINFLCGKISLWFKIQRHNLFWDQNCFVFVIIIDVVNVVILDLFRDQNCITLDVFCPCYYHFCFVISLLLLISLLSRILTSTVCDFFLFHSLFYNFRLDNFCKKKKEELF